MFWRRWSLLLTANLFLLQLAEMLNNELILIFLKHVQSLAFNIEVKQRG